MPLLRRIQTIAAAAETVEGTMVNIDSTHAKYLVQDAKFKVETTTIERDVNPASFARKSHLVTLQMARITFRTEVVGSGTVDTPTAWSLFLQGCNFKSTVNTSTSVQYDPISTAAYGLANGNVALTIWVYEDGKIKKARSCRGTGRMTAEAGAIAFWEWEFLGVFVAVDDGAYPALASGYDTLNPPLVESALASIQGIPDSSICFKTLTIDVGNTLTPRYCANSTKGFKSIYVSDRQVKGTIDPEDMLEADWDGTVTNTGPEERLVAALVGAFSATIGTVTGNKFQITAPAATVQFESVDEEDRDGIAVASIGFNFYVPFAEHATDKEIRFLTL